MNYSETFSFAWSIVRRHKKLWVFGLLAAIGGGGFNFTWNIGNQLETLFEVPLGTRALLRYLFGSSELTGAILTIGLMVGVTIFVIHTFAEGALIYQVNAIQQRHPASMRDGLRVGRRYFARLAIVRLGLALPLLVVGVLETGSLLPALSSFFTAPVGERLFSPSLVERLAGGGAAVLAIGLLVAALNIGAARAIVLGDMPVWPAIMQSARLLIEKFPDFVVITAIFTLIGIAVSVTFAIVLVPIMFLSVVPTIGSNVSGFDASMFLTDNFGPLAVIAITTALLFGTFVSAFASAVWTVAYRQWHYREVAHNANAQDQPSITSVFRRHSDPPK